jgi:diguanylate cyclase (GGDEF)-like protein
MAKFEIKSTEDASILRKFAILFLLASVFPLVFLTYVYYVLFSNGQIDVNSIPFLSSLILATIFSLTSFIYIRQSLSYINRISTKLKSALSESLPKVIDIEIKGNNEVASIAESFNKLVSKLENNITDLEKTRFLLTQALDREQMLSRTDYLTGIANRRVFYEFTEMEIQKFRRYGHFFTVLLIDIDNFKEINDSYGHQKGDEFLVLVARAIKNNIRLLDIPARIGGDEFAVLCTETGMDPPERIVMRLRDKLLDIMKENGWPTTFSMGVATYHVPPASVDEVMKKVDILMYSVKQGGKNNIKYDLVNK